MKRNNICQKVWIIFSATLGYMVDAGADSVDARCDIYPGGEDHSSVSIACTFSQRQGYITIDRSDGIYHDLEPVGTEAGNFADQDGRPVYRQKGLGEKGLIFRFPNESVFIYWDASTVEAMNPAVTSTDSPTSPYTRDEYDANTLLPCSMGQASYDQNCPAGIFRGDSGSASVRLTNPDGEERVLNFDQDDVTTPDGGQLRWRQKDGDWYINIDDDEFYIVVEAVVYGG